MLQWIKTGAGLLLFLIFYHVPMKELPPQKEVRALYHHDFQIHASVTSSFAQNVPPVVFHEGFGEATGGYFSRYRVYQLDKNGQNLETVELPPPAAQLQDELPRDVSLKGSGFLTYPENGKFFIWYPRLGKHVFFFGERGNFLWEKRSSHYLQVAPSGKWILAMAGDQSRAFFLYPDMDTAASVEGTLMVSSSSAPQQDQEVIYLAFLDGDVVRFDFNAKSLDRFHLAGPVKSVASGLRGENFLAQVEKEPGKDTLLAAAATGSTYVAEFEIELPRSYPASLPLARTPQGIAWMVPVEGGYEIHTADRRGLLQESIAIKSAGEPGIDDWRASLISGGVLFWSSRQYLVVDQTLLLHRRVDIINAKVKDDFFFLQVPGGVMAFEVR